MANGPTHRIAAALVVGGTAAYAEAKNNRVTLKPVAAATLAAWLTDLPDILEPAVNPHHRKFFHSLVCAGAVAYGTHKVYRWNPETTLGEFARFLLLVGGGAYLIHLSLDLVTPRSLPLI